MGFTALNMFLHYSGMLNRKSASRFFSAQTPLIHTENTLATQL